MTQQTIPETQKLLREQEVAELFQCSVKVLQSWRGSGKGLPFVRLSKGKRGAIRYEREAVFKWIEENRRINTCN